MKLCSWILTGKYARHFYKAWFQDTLQFKLLQYRTRSTNTDTDSFPKAAKFANKANKKHSLSLCFGVTFMDYLCKLPRGTCGITHVNLWEYLNESTFYGIYTAQKMKFSIKDFFSKCDQIRRNLWIWSHLLKKFSMENFIFCAVLALSLGLVKIRNCVGK